MKKITTKMLLGLVFFLFIGFSSSANNPTDLPFASPESQGMNPQILSQMNKHIKKYYPHIRSVVVLRNGNMVFEKYYHNYNQDSLFVICSATKTITSALVGIAIKEGYVTGVDQKIATFFPEYITKETDPLIKEITIENLLTMTSGLAWDDSMINTSDFMKNPIEYGFGLKVIDLSGKKFNYCTLGSQILSGIITKATKMDELAFADKNLFAPLGITNRKWLTDSQGNNWGGMELYLRIRDMAKIGQLFLNEGVWEGKEIIPKEWIKEVTTKHNEGGFPHGENYGWHCWITSVKGHPAYFAGGFGGQFIYVVPDLKIVMAITSDIDQHREYHRDIVKEFVIPAIKNK